MDIHAEFLALALMGCYLKDWWMTQAVKEVFSLLGKVPMEQVFQSDVISGAAGLLLVLCRFEKWYEAGEGKHVIRVCAGRLLALKTLELKEHPLLWDTLRLDCPVSGMGYGMAGIAAALMGTYRILGNQEYRIAAQMP